jgi:hypothetical protein
MLAAGPATTNTPKERICPIFRWIQQRSERGFHSPHRDIRGYMPLLYTAHPSSNPNRNKGLASFMTPITISEASTDRVLCDDILKIATGPGVRNPVYAAAWGRA